MPPKTSQCPYGEEMPSGLSSPSKVDAHTASQLLEETQTSGLEEPRSISLTASLEEFDAEFRRKVCEGDAFDRLVRWLADDSRDVDIDFGHADDDGDAENSTYVAEWRLRLQSPAQSPSTDSIRQRIDSSSGSEHRIQLNSNRAAYGFPPVDGIEPLDSAALSLDPLLGELFTRLDPLCNSTDDSYAAHAGAVMLQTAQTTILAISLLFKNGYVLDAIARWRGLHELACAANLIGASQNPEDCARRYLVHGGFISQSAAVDVSEAKAKWLRKDYGWLHMDFPGENYIGQSFLFKKLGTAVNEAIKSRWVSDSHSMVHMSSAAVSRGSVQAGGAPAGWSDALCAEYSVATLYSLSSLLSSVLELTLISGATRDREGSCRWYRELRITIDRSLQLVIAE